MQEAAGPLVVRSLLAGAPGVASRLRSPLRMARTSDLGLSESEPARGSATAVDLAAVCTPAVALPCPSLQAASRLFRRARCLDEGRRAVGCYMPQTSTGPAGECSRRRNTLPFHPPSRRWNITKWPDAAAQRSMY